MGYMNSQMAYPIHNGIRGGVETIDDFETWLEGIETWEQFKQVCITPYQYGNTKFIDFHILACYFYCGLNLNKAAMETGYTAVIDNAGTKRAAHGIQQRLQRICTNSPFAVIEPIIEKGWISRETIRGILIAPEKPTGTEVRMRNGKFFKFYAKWYVVSALEYFGQDAIITAEHLGIDLGCLVYWTALEVENILVTAR